MTSTESRSYCRVAVIAPSTRVDLALPVDVPIIDLLPLLLDYAGEARDDGGGAHGGWVLARTGQGALDGGRTLRSLDVVDGEALRLTQREAPTPPPLFDDVIDAIASTAREGINPRGVNPGLGAAAIVLAAAAGAFAYFYRAAHAYDAGICAAVAVVLLGLATAIAKGAGNRVVATATAAGGAPFALLVGVIAANPDREYGRWGLLLGCAILLVYALAAILTLGTGAATFSAMATAAVIAGLAALVTGLSDERAVPITAGALVVALLALTFLPRVSMRLARLPLGTVPTTTDDLAAQDELGDIDDVTARTRVAGEYLLGTTIGCAVVVAVASVIVVSQRTALAVALAAVCVVAMAMRARATASLGGRLTLLIAALAAGLGASAAPSYRSDGYSGTAGGAILVVDLVLVAVFVVLTGLVPRVRISPQAMRLVDLLESLLLVAALPLAVGVIGLYGTLRHL